MNLTTQQLAEILIGVARTQQALIDAIESSKAGFKGTYLAPALDSVAKIRSGRPLSLQDYPARVLLQCQGRAGPNIGQIVRDLEELLSGTAATPSLVAPATARLTAAAAKPAPATPAASAAQSTPAKPAPVAPTAAPTQPLSAKPAPAATAADSDDNDLDMTK